jgi:hypothetical protein
LELAPLLISTVDDRRVYVSEMAKRDNPFWSSDDNDEKSGRSQQQKFYAFWLEDYKDIASRSKKG